MVNLFGSIMIPTRILLTDGFCMAVSRWLLIVSAVLLSFSIGSTAEEATNIYKVEWPVQDRSSNAYETALIASFKEVLVRASGSAQSLNSDYVKESIGKASSYLISYRYVKNPDFMVSSSSTPDVPMSAKIKVPFYSLNQTSEFLLQFDFNPTAINRLLQDSGTPVWSGRRPITLMWIAYEQDFNRVLVNSSFNTNSPIQLSFDRELNRRALPALYPLMDLEDELAITTTDVWGQFVGPIQAASTRYGAEAVFAGRVVEVADGFQGRFIAIIKGKQSTVEFASQSGDAITQQSIDWLSELLCADYCVTESVSENSKWTLIIDDVGSFSAYRSLVNYIEKLSALRKADVAKVKGRALKITVDLVADVQALTQAIALDGMLSPIKEPALQDRLFELFNSTLLTQEPTISSNLNTSALNSSGMQSNLDKVNENLALTNTQQEVQVKQQNRATTLYYRWQP